MLYVVYSVFECMIDAIRKRSGEGGEKHVTSKNTRVETVSEPKLKTMLTEYFQRCDFDQSIVGFSSLEESWKQETVTVECGTALFRVLNSIDDCVLLFPDDDTEKASELGGVGGFDNVLVGTWDVSGTNDKNGDHVKLQVFGELLVLYSTAILIARYEKEISKRVLQQCENSVVEAVERKLREKRVQFEKQTSSNVSNTILSLEEVGCEIVSVELNSSYSRLTSSAP